MANAGFSLSSFSAQLVELVDRAAGTVVSVDGRQRRPGSGVVIASDLVVTADHVLERDDNVSVRAGNRQLAATIAGRDPATDVAVLRVPGLGGVESQRDLDPRPGQLVVSIARTASGGVSTGVGVITSVAGPLRTGRGIVLKQIVRTDAAARPGTSGGVIVNADGGVLAMTTSALLRGLPVGIPAAQLWDIAAALAASKPVNRAYLGVSVQPARFVKSGPDGAEGGLLISGIGAGTAADAAGLLVGDVIVGFNDRRMRGVDDLQDGLAALEAGAVAALSVIRGGSIQRVNVTVGARRSA